MRLLSLRLQNFRQHADTRLTFEPGLTGIIGPNGSGKSTLLEAIAWALYGTPAARGTRDSIRNTRAAPRAAVRVELEFLLAGHRYRVVRGLTGAECFLDGGETPIANTITGVGELLQRRLGMTQREFFSTYFTGQKELDVMSGMGGAERARFLSRVLGYDRLTGAQELAREARRALQAEATGVRQAMPDATLVARRVAEAAERLAAAEARAHAAAAGRDEAAARLAELAPRWAAAQAERERVQRLEADVRLAEAEALAQGRELERLDGELAAVAAAEAELEPLRQRLGPLAAQRAELATLDALAAADASRQVLLERERVLRQEAAQQDERLAQLEAAPALEEETREQLAAQRLLLAALDDELAQRRAAWVGDRQEAETRLEALRAQYADVQRQRETLEGLGEESPCPTCGRPLGASYRGVLDLLAEQLETLRIDGNYYRQRAAQLAQPPEAVTELEEKRRQAQHDVTAAERRLARIEAALAERAKLVAQRRALDGQLVETAREVAALATGYDAGRHAFLREQVARLAEVETQAVRLRERAARAAEFAAARARAAERREAALARVAALHAERPAAVLSAEAFEALRAAHADADAAARRAELDATGAAGALQQARGELEAAARQRAELARLEARLAELEADRRLHDELDRAFGDLRTDLNAQLRPELAEVASRFLDQLTDGRYQALEFDEAYTLTVLEDGLPKPVISGGEEDLCNLVLRLAISQMIAERAGQAFSLLVLDEVFGSLDDVRRGNVVELLKRLNDRFEQVIVITHIEPVREGLDRVLLVRFDEERGSSVVTPAEPAADVELGEAA